eukprot:TRINITY_DN19007_c0_g2_i1.p1 TRINITY_DN19007_c0_g2~~TRINITY_DN19007_c0_g2_i1.p1  ORF type:complete len:188 (-),score=15.56 TRINITY_DN19007_c0_g2_i1:136-699(-)
MQVGPTMNLTRYRLSREQCALQDFVAKSFERCRGKLVSVELDCSESDVKWNDVVVCKKVWHESSRTMYRVGDAVKVWTKFGERFAVIKQVYRATELISRVHMVLVTVELYQMRGTHQKKKLPIVSLSGETSLLLGSAIREHVLVVHNCRRHGERRCITHIDPELEDKHDQGNNTYLVFGRNNGLYSV